MPRNINARARFFERFINADCLAEEIKPDGNPRLFGVDNIGSDIFIKRDRFNRRACAVTAEADADNREINTVRLDFTPVDCTVPLRNVNPDKRSFRAVGIEIIIAVADFLHPG